MILKIKNKTVDFFNSVTLNLKYNSEASTFAFLSYFNSDNPEHREIFHLGHYHTVTVEHKGELLLTGTLLSQVFSDSSVKQLASLSGYSLPGVLRDSEIPVSLYPLQSDGLSLNDIATKLLRPFRIKMVVDSSVSSGMNKVYDTITANEDQTVIGYIEELAKQRNIIISHDVYGRLLFTSAKKSAPIIDFDGIRPATEMSLSFSGQGMHSEITVIKEQDFDEGNAGESTINNPFLSNSVTYRSKVKKQSSGDDNDTQLAAKMILASQIKNIKLTIKTDRWDINGKVFKPGSIVSVRNPKIYLYKKSNWLIESVVLTGDEKSKTAMLNCVLPCVYDGTTPKNIFE